MRLAVFVSLVLVASASAAAPRDGNNLHLTGALQTSSEKVVDTGSGCGFANRTLTFQSGAMRLGNEPQVARVSFELRQFRGRGVYNGTTRPLRGWAPVQVITAKNATTGAGSRRFYALRGGVHVMRVDLSGARPTSAWGFVGAWLTEGGVRLGHGKPTIRLRGSWRCAEIAR